MSLNETKTSICNKALALLGEEPINSVEDNTTKAARVCKQYYDLSLQSVLSEGKWPFATLEEPVVRLTLPDYAKEQKYTYAIPNDCVLVVGLTKRFNRKSMRKGIDWDIRYIPEIKNSAIICNLDSKADLQDTPEIDHDEQILIEYIKCTNESRTYPAAFVRCLAAQLAADMCMPITHDSQRFAAMVQLAMQLKSQALQQALNEDGQDKMSWIDPITASREGCL